MPMSFGRDPNSLLEMLLKAFNQEVFAVGFTASDEVRNLVRKMILKGVNELVKHTTQNHQVIQAEEDIRTLARHMISEATADGRTELKEIDFITVIRLFCPLWPFC
jgi:hypothetical protein